MIEFGQEFLQLKEVLSNNKKLYLSENSLNRIKQAYNKTQKIASSGKVVYGINTGFGPLCETIINPNQLTTLQKNLLMSHAVGVGSPISKELTRWMLITKLHALSKGYSGISVDVAERIEFMIKKEIIPVVPSQGSVGASGDLAPLAHLFLPLIGMGYIWDGEKKAPASEILKYYNLEPLNLQAKEGLALINGTQFILAHAIVGIKKFAYLLDLADIVGALSLEAFQGSDKPFDERLHKLRPFSGSQIVAKRLRKLLEGSENLASHQNCKRVQDPYSLRCMPQVHGAARNAYQHLFELTEIELNSVTDNPIIVEEGEAISGGNFHGQLLSMALDYATLAASEIGNISDRRCYLLLEGKYELPKLLIKDAGLNSGLMILQYTTAALVTENKSLCFPASADSIPTSMGQEDHVSMGSISGRKFLKVLENVEKILAIELLCATQAFHFRRPLKTSPILERIISMVVEVVPEIQEDRFLGEDIEKMINLIRRKEFKKLIESIEE